MSTRTFDDKPAVREAVPLLIGITGPSGGGKTYSALRLATGIQSVTGGDIYGIDTEARRMLNYSEKFKFRHLEFKAPFSPLDYLAAVENTASPREPKLSSWDSMSHEHEATRRGPSKYTGLRFSAWAAARRTTFRAWAKPKSDRRRFINAILADAS